VYLSDVALLLNKEQAVPPHVFMDVMFGSRSVGTCMFEGLELLKPVYRLKEVVVVTSFTNLMLQNQ